VITQKITIAILAILLMSASLHASENEGSFSNVPQSVLQAEADRVQAISTALRSSISVFANDGGGGGSGVVISSDGYALTNYHVVQPVGEAMKCSMPDGLLYDAVIVGIDPTGDVALIKLLGRDDFPSAVMGDSDQVRVGDWCFAVGNPFLLATDFQPTVTYGLVSGIHRYQYPAGTLLEYADCLQTDAAINPGNSGGPLFDKKGHLIGVNGRGSFEKRGRVNVGVGYAISINQIKNFMGFLQSGRIVDHATLGASVSTDEDGRVIVTNILKSSDAYRRGLRYGDEILSFGNRVIQSANELKNTLGIYPKGWRVPIEFNQDGKRQTRLVRLAGVHREEELLGKMQQMSDPPHQEKPVPDQERKNGKREGDGQDGPTPDGGEKSSEKDQSDGPPSSEPTLRQTKSVPESIAPVYESRRGFANYYFNRLHRDRIWKALLNHGDFQNRDGAWTLRGQVDGEDSIELVISSENVDCRFGDEQALIDLKQDLDAQLVPHGSGGLLVALHLWHRFLTMGPEQFGEVYYLGTAPMSGQKELVDVLVAIHDTIEVHFQFDVKTGYLLGMEMYPERDVDPCEVRFDRYEARDGKEMPYRMEVRYGDKSYGIIEFEDVQMDASSDDSA